MSQPKKEGLDFGFVLACVIGSVVGQFIYYGFLAPSEEKRSFREIDQEMRQREQKGASDATPSDV